ARSGPGNAPAAPRGRGSSVRTSRPAAAWAWPAPYPIAARRRLPAGGNRAKVRLHCAGAGYGRQDIPMTRRRAIAAMLLAATLALLAMPAMAAGYRHHLAGDPTLPTSGTPTPGLLLLRGGDRNVDALHWFLDKALDGHVVVL